MVQYEKSWNQQNIASFFWGSRASMGNVMQIHLLTAEIYFSLAQSVAFTNTLIPGRSVKEKTLIRTNCWLAAHQLSIIHPLQRPKSYEVPKNGLCLSKVDTSVPRHIMQRERQKSLIEKCEWQKYSSLTQFWIKVIMGRQNVFFVVFFYIFLFWATKACLI